MAFFFRNKYTLVKHNDPDNYLPRSYPYKITDGFRDYVSEEKCGENILFLQQINKIYAEYAYNEKDEFTLQQIEDIKSLYNSLVIENIPGSINISHEMRQASARIHGRLVNGNPPVSYTELLHDMKELYDEVTFTLDPIRQRYEKTLDCNCECNGCMIQ